MENLKYLWFIIPILFAIISAKRFNWLHGIVVFIFTGIMFVGLTDLIVNLQVWDWSKSNSVILSVGYSEVVTAATLGRAYCSAGYDIIVDLVQQFVKDFDIVVTYRYLIYIVSFVLWIIFRAMAGAIKKR